MTITATDNAGYSGTATLQLDHHQHGVGDQPRVTRPTYQARPSPPLPITATDSSAGATLTYSDGGTLPRGCPSIRPAARSPARPPPVACYA